jgi:hypothetical protein
MKSKMDRDRKILLMLAILIALTLLVTLWATSEPLGSPPERQGWSRWYLTDAQRNEITRLIRAMMENRTRWEVIKAAVDAKLSEWKVNPPPPGDIELFYTIKTVVSTINIALVIILLLTYIQIYWKTKSEFTLGLIIFSVVLFFYTLASNPIMQWAFGFRAFGLGPFAMLPDLFSLIALSVLLYLSLK